jgi:hypothetical protein
MQFLHSYHYERQKLEMVVKDWLIRGRVEKVGILLPLLLENDCFGCIFIQSFSV